MAVTQNSFFEHRLAPPLLRCQRPMRADEAAHKQTGEKAEMIVFSVAIFHGL